MPINNYGKKNLKNGQIITESYLSDIEASLLDSTTAINQNISDIANLTTSIASKVGQSAIDTAITNIKGGVDASGDTLAKLRGLINNIETLLLSDDVSLDTIQEIVTYIKSEKTLIDSITTNKVNVADIIDNLISTVTNKPLSAKQGKTLKDLLDVLRTFTNESTGSGIISGLNTSAQSTPDMTVNVTSGVVHLSDGTRLASSGSSSVTVSASDAIRPRIDLVYLNTTDSTVGYVKGAYPTVTAGSRTYAITTNAVANDTVTINGVILTAVASGATGNQFNVGATITDTATNLTSALNSISSINSVFTVTSSAEVITITEKVAGNGSTPTMATRTGTIIIVNRIPTVSACGTPIVPATPANGLKLSEIYVSKGITSINNINVIDKRVIKMNNNDISTQISNNSTSISNISKQVKQNKLYMDHENLRPYLIESFKTTASFWSATNCTLAQDTTTYLTGNSSLAVTCTSAGNAASFNWTCDVDASQMPYFEFKVYMPDATKINQVKLSLYNASSYFGYYYAYTVTAFVNGWNTIRFPKSAFTKQGTVAWTDMIRSASVSITPVAGATPVVNVELLKGFVPNPYVTKPANIIFCLDDGIASAYSVAYPYLKSKGLKASFGIIGSFLDTNGYMTTSNLFEMRDNGQDLLNHGWAHLNYTSLGYTAIANDIQRNREFLWNNGITKGNDIIIYPNGYSDNGKMVAKDLKFNCGRDGTGGHIYGSFPDDTLKVPAYMMLPADNLASVKSYVDTAISMGGALIIYGHDLVSSPTGTQMSDTGWKEVVDYVYSQYQLGNCVVTTLSDYYESLFH